MLYSATIYEFCNTTYTLEKTFVMLYALYDKFTETNCERFF